MASAAAVAAAATTTRPWACVSKVDSHVLRVDNPRAHLIFMNVRPPSTQPCALCGARARARNMTMPAAGRAAVPPSVRPEPPNARMRQIKQIVVVARRAHRVHGTTTAKLAPRRIISGGNGAAEGRVFESDGRVSIHINTSICVVLCGSITDGAKTRQLLCKNHQRICIDFVRHKFVSPKLVASE